MLNQLSRAVALPLSAFLPKSSQADLLPSSLSFLVLSDELVAGFYALGKNLIKVFRNAKLVLLQLRQVVDHDCVLEVGGNQRLK